MRRRADKGCMTLDPDLETMRSLGHRAIDLAVEHLAGMRDKRVFTPPDAARLEALVAEPLPRAGHGAEDSLERFFRDLLPHATLVNHPRFFAYIPGPGSFLGALGEWLAASTNPFTGTFIGGAVHTQIETQTLHWLRDAVGLPDTFEGMITSGGSMANLCGLGAAIHGHCRARATVYASAEGHHSLTKAAAILGITPGHVRLIPSDDQLRMDVHALRAAVAADRAAGLEAVAVLATGGTTSSGSVDPLSEIADFCEAEGLWLHVDCAYGAAMALLPEGRDLLQGWERADSITMDPHKWFYAPFECGCVLTRHVKRLEAAFDADGAYMQDVPPDAVNFYRRGPELTRGGRAMKLWMLLRSAGTDAIARAVRADVENCHLAHELLRADPRIAIVTAPRMSMFSFAPRAGEEAGRRLVARLQEDGHTMLSSTRLHGRFAIRFCVVNHRTTATDIREAVQRVLDTLAAVLPARG